MGEGVLIDSDDLLRIGRGITRLEAIPEQTPGVAASREPGRPVQTIRAMLLEPLLGHGEALAMRCRREKFSRLVDMQVVGGADPGDSWAIEIRTAIPGIANSVETDPFGVNATAEEVHGCIVRALSIDPLDLFVAGGRMSAEIVSEELRTDSVAGFNISRWSLAFVGDVFSLSDPVCIPRRGTGSSSSMLVTSESTWRPTGEVVKLIEAGFNPKSYRSYGSSQPTQFPLVAGSVVLAHWCDDADGYVVGGAEPRKFRI
jgi:hypothetical protein